MWSRRQSLAGVAALAALATDSGAWAGVGENQPQAAKRPETAQRLILIGDSTVADYPPARRPLAGWGQMLRAQLAGRAYVVNHAVPGASSTSFRRQKWGLVHRLLAPKDILLAQFGHVDALSDATHSQVSIAQFQDNLRFFVDQAVGRGARALLVTPIARHHFAGDRVMQVLQPYVEATRAIATETRATLVDLSTNLSAAMEKEGKIATRQWFMLGFDGHDTVHLSRLGASIAGRMVAQSLQDLGLV